MVPTIVLVVLLVAAALFFYLVAPGRRRDTGRFERKAFAHRGLFDNKGGIPENSLAAFRRARAHADAEGVTTGHGATLVVEGTV